MKFKNSEEFANIWEQIEAITALRAKGVVAPRERLDEEYYEEERNYWRAAERDEYMSSDEFHMYEAGHRYSDFY